METSIYFRLAALAGSRFNALRT